MGNKQRIMVVDDSRSICQFMSAMLTNMGYQVETSLNGKDAYQRICSNLSYFELVFIDLDMPEIDGMELMRNLTHAGFKGAMVILSAMDSRIVTLAGTICKQNQTKLLASINKPINEDKLLGVLQKFASWQEGRGFEETLSGQELTMALAQNRVVPYYQPKVDLRHNRVHSVEVLARIQDANSNQVITPNKFIKTAEQHNLINLITYQLFEKATFEFAQLQKAFGEQLKLSVNLSPLQLEDLDCPNKLGNILKEKRISSRQIIFEVTENKLLQSAAQLETLNRLRIRNYGAAMDDFGAGYTNIQQLRNLPFSEIKIDRSLVANVQNDHFSQVVIKSLNDIANDMDVEIVAEGVETIEELDFLRQNYSNLLYQGYLICKPKPLTDLLLWSKHWNQALKSAN